MTGQLFGESSSIWNVTNSGAHSGSDDLKDWENNTDKDANTSDGTPGVSSSMFFASVILIIMWNGF